MATTVTVMPDYSAFPLWQDGGRFMIRPEDLALSDELRCDLQAWNDEWDRTLSSNGFEVPEGWARNPWHERGRHLARRVAAELGDEFAVVYHDVLTGERIAIEG